MVAVATAGSVLVAVLVGAGSLLAVGAAFRVVLVGNPLVLALVSTSASGTSTAVFSLFSSVSLDATRLITVRLPLDVSDSAVRVRLRVVGTGSSSSGSDFTVAALALVERLVGDSGMAMESISSFSSTDSAVGVMGRAEELAVRRVGAVALARVVRAVGLDSSWGTAEADRPLRVAGLSSVLADEAVRVSGLVSSVA